MRPQNHENNKLIEVFLGIIITPKLEQWMYALTSGQKPELSGKRGEPSYESLGGAVVRELL